MSSRLDTKLLKKLAEKIGKSVKYTREQIAKRASRAGVFSEAYFLHWLKTEKIPAQRYMRSLSIDIQNQARSLDGVSDSRTRSASHGNGARSNGNTLAASSRYVDLLEIIQDNELRDRCADLIKRPRNHDRAFREATTILEDRIKRLTGITRMNPQNLVGKALNPDPTKAILVVSNDPDEQAGFFKICSGIEAAFRNRTHHEVSDKLNRYDAIKFCGFIDSLLLVLAGAEVHKERI